MKKTQFKLFVIVLAIGLLMPGCASIVSKSSYPVSINSNPQGAELVIKNRKGKEIYNGVTPATVKLDASSSYMKGEKYTVSFNAFGYHEQTVNIGSKLDGWYGANLFIGGIIGWFIVDPLTGAMFKLDDTPVNVTLQKAAVETNATINIIDINSQPEDNINNNLVQINPLD